MRIKMIIVVVSLFLVTKLNAQSILSSTVSIHAKNQALHEVLTIIGNEANVTFSYNTKSIRRDTLVTLNAVNKPAPILPKTTSALLSEVIKRRMMVCLSFSWLTAVVPANAAVNMRTMS